MSGVGLEVLLEDLIPEIAYSGEKGVSITELLKIVRQYHLSIGGQDASIYGGAANQLQMPVDDSELEKSLTDAEMSSARWAWDWLRTRPQILINGNKRWNRLELSEALALPEAESIDPAITAASADARESGKAKSNRARKTLTTRPRIHPSEDLVWQTLTRHGVDYKRVPALEWACLQGIASARAEGILQSDLRRLVDQDKRSLPKRTDSLARKGYIAKRTVVVQKMKTSRLWLIDFAPPLVEAETCGLDLTPETLSKDLEPVSWHKRWTENTIDMDALGRTVVGVVKAFQVIRYADLRLKMGVSGKRWQMKTLAKNCQRLVDVGVFKYTAASFPGTRKVFKDCLKFVREPSAEEWDKFLATGKKTSLYSDPSRHREPKPHALALYGKAGEDGQGSGDARSKLKRIFSGWTPEKPLAQTVFEVIQSAGPEGASNPQVSVATVGYQHRRYLSSYLTKVAETQQPPHLKKFQVVSKLVRTGKTSAYMFSAPGAAEQAALPQPDETETRDGEKAAAENPYGFGAVRTKALSSGENFSLSQISAVARKMKPSSKRKLLPRIRAERVTAAEAAPGEPSAQSAAVADQEPRPADSESGQSLKRPFDEITAGAEGVQDAAGEPPGDQGQPAPFAPAAADEAPRVLTSEDLKLDVRYNGIAGKLQVHQADRKVTFLRSGRGLKKPFVILIDDSLDEPTLQVFSGDSGDEKRLVLVVGGKEGALPLSHVFVYDNQGQKNANWIRHEIIRLKDAGSGEPNFDGNAAASAPEGNAAAPEAVTAEAAAPAGSVRGKKRGRGGARGRGRKGQPLPAGAKPYVCSLCGGAWKNDIGLKYHLEKAQVPCNPNFDPATVIERARKRRRLSPPPPSTANSEAGDEDISGRTRRARSGRKSEKQAPRLQPNIRTAMRPVQGPAHTFRGVTAAGGDGVDDSASWILERPKGAFKAVTLVPATQTVAGSEAFGLTGNKIVPVSTSVVVTAKTGAASKIAPMSDTGNDTCRRSLPAIDTGTVGTVVTHQQPEPSQGLPTAPATPALSRVSKDGGAAGDGFDDKPSDRPAPDGLALQPANEPPRLNGYEELATTEHQPEPSRSEYPDLPPHGVEDAASYGTDTSTSQSGHLIFKPFTRSTNYDRLSTEPKRRTAQAFDIINHLLDNNLGVFPGDKALFYAMTNVFLKEFPNQMPPTWKNCTSAIKAVESRKLAAVHTHMLKTERGRLQTCTLLVRTGVDPNGIIGTRMKQKMRETYPAIFIPPAFSPTQEELALLQELDKKTTDTSKPNANGQKFRSRRKIEEIEVFNAPYYTNAAPPVPPKRDPLWIREAERPRDGFAGRGRPTDDPSLGPTWKIETGYSGDGHGDIPVDPSMLGATMSPPRYDQREGPSVLEAIKTYSLLPPKVGPRGRRLSYHKPLTKLPRELGRIKNPGLGSLPGFFFGRDTDAAAFQFASPEVAILDPNTSLGEDAEGGQEDQDREQLLGRRGSGSVWDRPAAGEVVQSSDEAKNIEFVWPSMLEPTSRGVWPDHSLRFFEHYEGSFTLNGWMPDQRWLLAQNIPTSAWEMAEKQKADKIKLRDWVDREYARFCSVINQCAAWEQSRTGTSVMLGSSVLPAYHYISVSPPPSRANNRAVSLKWSEETQYDLETLPYGDLEDDDYGDVIYVEDAPERTVRDDEPTAKKRRVQKPAPPQAKRMPGRPPKLKLAAIKTMREHTSYPKTADDLLRNNGEEDLDWSSENVRLAAFIVVTTLLGGVDRVVDWGLMLRLMPDQTISQLRHYWCALKKDRQSTIVSLTDKFRRAFLRAYEQNEIPPIDFDNVLAYDWKSLIKWTTKLDMTERRTLPSTREALDRTVTVANFKHGNRPWREAFYHPQRSMFNKFQDATCEPLAFSVDGVSDPKPDIEMIVAMSWTRSLCVTPVEAYTADAVLQRRNSLFPHRTKTEITELMIKGVEQLQQQGVISKSSAKWSNGRRWRFNTRVVDCLEKAAQQDKFRKAVEFKRELDRAFRSGETKKRVTYITNDGMILALLNLQANGRVRIETTGQPHVPMGHEPGNYETRKYTKKYMHFRLDIVPTESYIYDEADTEAGEDGTLSELHRAVRAAAPPTSGPGGAVPVWCDVFGKVNPERWLKHLSAVLITLASRGSMPAEELVQTLKPVIMAFEAELILEWLAALGLLRAQFEGASRAVMEWWWIAVEMQREGLFGGVQEGG